MDTWTQPLRGLLPLDFLVIDLHAPFLRLACVGDEERERDQEIWEESALVIVARAQELSIIKW